MTLLRGVAIAPGSPVAYTRHDFTRGGVTARSSPCRHGAIRSSTASSRVAGDIVVEKDVNSGCVGTSARARSCGEPRHRPAVIAGFFTNMCVETTTRMAGNLGSDTYPSTIDVPRPIASGPTALITTANLVHQLTFANLHGEF